MAIILANRENSCPLRNVTNYMGTLRKVKGVHPLMDKGFRLLWYICMGEVQLYHVQKRVSQISPHRT